MAHQVKPVAAKPDDLNKILGTYMVKEKTGSCKLSSDLHICTVAWESIHVCVCAHTTHTVYIYIYNLSL